MMRTRRRAYRISSPHRLEETFNTPATSLDFLLFAMFSLRVVLTTTTTTTSLFPIVPRSRPCRRRRRPWDCSPSPAACRSSFSHRLPPPWDFPFERADSYDAFSTTTTTTTDDRPPVGDDATTTTTRTKTMTSSSQRRRRRRPETRFQCRDFQCQQQWNQETRKIN